MTATTGFANRGTITVGGAGTSPGTLPTTQTCGVVKDVEVTVSAEHVPLYGWGSIIRQGVAKHSLKVSVKIGQMKFDPDVTAGWIFGIGAAPDVQSDGTFTDTNLPKLFNIVAEFTFEDAGVLTATITDVFFPDLPIKATEGQWIKLDFTGEGSGITFEN